MEKWHCPAGVYSSKERAEDLAEESRSGVKVIRRRCHIEAYYPPFCEDCPLWPTKPRTGGLHAARRI